MDLERLYHRFIDALPGLLTLLPVVLAIIVGVMVLNLLIGRALLLLARRTHLTEMDVQPVKHVARWVLRIIALVLILGVLGFELGGLWAMISTVLGLVAIGFVAVWSILSNTSATLLILFLRPFQVGDDIELVGDGVSGRVSDLNFFFTTLVDENGNLLQIPNNLFFQKTLKRCRNRPPVSLAAQLNSPGPANVDRPPPGKPADARTTGRNEPDPLMNVPDPRTIAPPSR